MSSNNTKEKTRRNCLGFNDKLDILDRLDSGEPACDIAVTFNINPSTVSKIKSGRETIEKRKEMLSSCQGNFEKKRFRGTEESLLESAVLKWMSENKHTGAISSSAVRKVAVDVHKHLNINKKFTASPGWIRRFRSRHGISIKNMRGKKSLANVEACKDFKSSFDGLIKLTGVDNLDSECEEELECDKDVSMKEVYGAINLISRWLLSCDNENLINASEQLKPFRKYIAEKLLGNGNNK